MVGTKRGERGRVNINHTTYRTLAPGFQEQLSNAMKLRPVYTQRDVENACAKISSVSFFQEIVCRRVRCEFKF